MSRDDVLRPSCAAGEPAADAPAVRVREVGKCYRIYDRPQDRLLQALGRRGKPYYREFWSLQDVSFDAPRGSTIGIVGRNGCGKSTLLQIICGTLTPTFGSVEVHGRIAALLELGSGFNPDFTGRENIYLNAALLGLPRDEIEQRFDDIVRFSELAPFIDRPVKTYSSGMFVRLAFAVATSVDPDILVVDEALSVGDEAFQRKCFGRIQEISDRGGTILFVSHAASTIVELCDTVHLLDAGTRLLSGHPKLAVAQYHRLLYAPPEQVERLREEIRELDGQPEEVQQATLERSCQARTARPRPTAPPATKSAAHYDPNLVPSSTISYPQQGGEIRGYRITTDEDEPVNVLVAREEYVIRYTTTIHQDAHRVRFATLIKNVHGTELGGAITPGDEYAELTAGSTVAVEFRFRCLLTPGTYFLNTGVSGLVDGEQRFLHRVTDCLMFRVVPPAEETVAYGPLDLLVQPHCTVVEGSTLSLQRQVA